MFRKTIWRIFGPLIFQIQKKKRPALIMISQTTCQHCGYWEYDPSHKGEKVIEGQNGWTEWGQGWEGIIEKTCQRCGHIWEFNDGFP